MRAHIWASTDRGRTRHNCRGAGKPLIKASDFEKLLLRRICSLKRTANVCKYVYVNTGVLVSFEWDAIKAATNLVKHGVAFELAQEVWDDPLHVILPDRVIDGEQRWHAIGVVGLVTVLVAVHTYPLLEDESHIRIIGARRATAHERKRYEEDNA